jgi:hypothetical protein
VTAVPDEHAAPPTRPRRAARWPFLLVLALIATAYAGSCVRVRRDNTLVAVYGFPDAPAEASGRRVRLLSEPGASRTTWLVYAPCIIVEEWWLAWVD